MFGNRRNFVKSFLVVVILYDVMVVNIEGGRRISFGKRISKPNSKGSRGGDAKVKDTTSEPEAEDEVTEGLEHSMKCKGVNMELNEKQVLHLKECASSVGVKSSKDMTIEKVPCFAKCIFEHKKLVDEKGMPHKENIVNMFSEMMTEEVKEELKKSLEKCIDEHGSMAEPTDETCQSYTPLAMCVHVAYDDICRPNE